ncbi:MAG: sigma-70 family RNA polymerase sigma factor [Longimicrobiales bacterium]
MNRQEAFLANLGTIERIIGAICRRHHVPAVDQEDFDSYAKKRLMDGDYAVFGKFRGESSLTTYLNTVVGNYFRDYRSAQWGRWRPSAEARRLGPQAIRLEELIYRDGNSPRQAIAILRSIGGDLPGDRELYRLACQLPERTRTVIVAPDPANETPAPIRTDDDLEERERATLFARVMAALFAALATLPEQDQLIVRMRYLEDFSVADIARVLGIEQKPLYRRIDANKAWLLGQLESSGVDRDLVKELLARQ